MLQRGLERTWRKWPCFQSALTGFDLAEVVAWIAVLPGPVQVAYEAGPTGFGLFRLLMSAQIECVVAAPSKLQRPTGDRVKTDARDALHLARLLPRGEIVAVTVPSIEEETARDLVRAREDTRQDLIGARHRLSKLLLRHGLVYADGAAQQPRAIGREITPETAQSPPHRPRTAVEPIPLARQRG